MTRFLEIKNFLGLTKVLKKKKDPPQNKTQTKEKKLIFKILIAKPIFP
jgi:hypothetical protein